MSQVVLLIGGNLGDREMLIHAAVEQLGRKFRLVKTSSLYETAAWGGKSSGDYLNQAVVVETDWEPEKVLDFTQAVEIDLGRKRKEKWGDRTMDIDIIYFGNRVIKTARLAVPHPHLPDRKFVLMPLVEIMPDFVHPILRKTNQALLDACTDIGKVIKL